MKYRFSSALFFTILFLSCAKDVTRDYDEKISIPAFGQDNQMEIATWNIENFPRTPITDSLLTEIIGQLEIDLVGVEEIVDTAAFYGAISKLPSYNARLVYYPDLNHYGYITQNIGIIYNNTCFDEVKDEDMELLFINDNNFPRPPLKVKLHYTKNGADFEFYAVVMHLKAMSDATSVSRREASIESLHDYLNNLPELEDHDFVLLGDWNSDYTQEDFLLNTFHADSMFNLLTYSFYDNTDKYSYNASYPNYSSLIDHIVISKSFEEQISDVTIKTIRLDDYYSKYLDLVSDHRPVAVRFNVN